MDFTVNNLFAVLCFYTCCLATITMATCPQGGCPVAGYYFALGQNMVNNHALELYVFERSTVSSLVECYNKCRLNCRCISFNYLTTVSQDNCELNDESRYLKPSDLKAKEGYHYYDLVIYYNVKHNEGNSLCPGCQNGCCRAPSHCSSPGTLRCEESCDVNGKRFRCICKSDGWRGDLCDIDECSSNPCLNQGTCHDLVNSYSCSCVPGFTGRQCETDINECSSNPCLNQGTCNNLVNNYSCSCVPGFIGRQCETYFRTPLFQVSSYMMFPYRDIERETHIIIRFKPTALNGVLFYVTDTAQIRADFLSIVLHNGFVKLRYDLNSGVGEARSSSIVSLNTWNTVDASRHERDGTLILNDDSPVIAVSPVSAKGLHVDTNFHLGGVPNSLNMNSKTVDSAGSSVPSFSGCIDYFQVNGVVYSLTTGGALEEGNISLCTDSSD